MRRRHNYSTTFLLDEGVCGPDVVAPLRTVEGWTIEVHHDHLARGVPDTEVIEKCAENQWALITGDDEIRFTRAAQELIALHAVPVFMVVLKKKSNAVQIHSAIVAAKDRILNAIRKTKVGFCASVQLGGTLNVTRYFDPLEIKGVTAAQLKTIRRYGLEEWGRVKNVG